MLNDIVIQTDGTNKNTKIYIDGELTINLSKIDLNICVNDAPTICSLEFFPEMKRELDFRDYMFLGDDKLEIKTDGTPINTTLTFNGNFINNVVEFYIFIELNEIKLFLETYDGKIYTTFEEIKNLFIN